MADYYEQAAIQDSCARSSVHVTPKMYLNVFFCACGRASGSKRMPSNGLLISQHGKFIYLLGIYKPSIYRVSQEERARLREGVPYVKVYRYNPKHLCPKLNSYGDNGQRKVWSSGGSTHCTCQLTSLIDVCP